MTTGAFAVLWDRLQGFEDDGVDVPAWLDDRQARSRATRVRILLSASRLLETRDFREISLEEIAAASGVSVGAVYARFPSKESILALLGLAVFEQTRQRFEESLSRVPAGGRMSEVGLAYADVLVAELGRHRRLIRELRGHAAGAPEIRGLMARGNDEIHRAFLDRAVRHRDKIRHPDPDSALRYGLFMMNASAREAILAGALDGYDVEDGGQSLTEQLVRAFCGYLGVKFGR